MAPIKGSSFNCIPRKEIFAIVLVIGVVVIALEITGTSRFSMKYKTVLQMISYDNDKLNISNLLDTFGAAPKTAIPKTITFSASHTNQTKTTTEPCPLIPPDLKESIPVVKIPLNFTEIEDMYPTLLPGGLWEPTECKARSRVAIIVPYRNRTMHLKLFLRHMHAFLQKQQLDYGIFIIEQALPTRFNRGLLMNIGFVESLKLHDYQCFVLHDVDLLPESELNLYTCPEQPRHLSIAIDIWNYKVKWADIFGGVTELAKEHMEKVNGFSNKFFGWGGEDDDLQRRVKTNGYKILKYPLSIARYTMLSHKKADPNPQRFTVLAQGPQRYKNDGLNSLKYKVLKLEKRSLYTWVYIDVNEEEVKKS